MTVHELYEAKKREYAQFEVKMGVYENRLGEAKASILASAEELKRKLGEVEASPITERIIGVIARIQEWQDSTAVDGLKSIQSELEAISVDLEYQIRRVLE